VSPPELVPDHTQSLPKHPVEILWDEVGHRGAGQGLKVAGPRELGLMPPPGWPVEDASTQEVFDKNSCDKNSCDMEGYRDLSGDPSAMLALAHPTRLALLELLGADGPLTASEAGRRLGESAGTMSWHLRLLARHGFVAEAEGGRGRRRPWAVVALGTRWDTPPRSEQERAAADLLSSMTVERAIAQLRSWVTRRHSAPPAWQRAAALSQWTLYLTAGEAQQLREDIYRMLVEQFADRLENPARRPAAAVATRALISIFPQDTKASEDATR